MALVTIHAVVDVSTNTRVIRIRGRLGMTIGALENGVVTRIGVAGRAHSVGAPVGHRPPRVIESGSSPSGCRVAGCAGRCEHRWRSRVDRIRGREVVRLVAAVAIGGQGRVVVIHMATGTGHRGVRASQREWCGVVIEGAVRPQGSVMTKLAGRGEAHLNVVNRRRCVVVVGQMARHARRIRARQVVIIVDMAIGANARGYGMRIGQRKSSGGVVEFAIRPNHCVVATFASRGKRPLDVIHRRRSGVVVVHVARNAGRAAQAIVVVDMAIGTDARGIRVSVCQRKSHGTVVERRRLPSNRRVALLAILRKSPGHVIWIRGPLKILQMATGAGCAG